MKIFGLKILKDSAYTAERKRVERLARAYEDVVKSLDRVCGTSVSVEMIKQWAKEERIKWNISGDYDQGYVDGRESVLDDLVEYVSKRRIAM